MLHDENTNNNNTIKHENDNDNKLLLDASQEQQPRRVFIPKGDQVAAGLISPTVLTPAHLPAAPVSISAAAGDNNNNNNINMNNNNNNNSGGGYANAFRCPPTAAAAVNASGTMGNNNPTLIANLPQVNRQIKKPVTPAAGRSGRAPNTNENSLQRRLECVLAVEEGMNMVDACAAYDISTRTFYRWLRSKPKLVELTSAAATKTASPLAINTGNNNGNTNSSPVPVTSVAPVHPVHRPAKRTRHTPAPKAPPQSRHKTLRFLDGRTRIEVVHPSKNGDNDNDNNNESENSKNMDVNMNMDNKKGKSVALNWYEGATGKDIKEAIKRRFGLKEDEKWGINGSDSEEVIISPGMPSGKYFLFFSKHE